MKFALLGADPQTLTLATAAIGLGHEVIWYGDVPLSDRDAHPWLIGSDESDRWEVLCDRRFCDFVIVGRGAFQNDRRVSQLIQILKHGMGVITSFPLCESVLYYYEVDMARTESGTALFHFNPLVSRVERIKEFSEWIQNGHPQLGRIEQLICERPAMVRSRESVMWHFPRDVELLDRIAGPLDRLGAMGSPNAEATYSALSVQLLGKSEVPVRWSITPSDQTQFPSLTFIASSGRNEFRFDKNGVFMPGGDNTTFTTTDVATSCVKTFITALSDPGAVQSTWPNALRAMELTDTIEISLRRGRVIDVHRQQLTEELAFRGTMSAVGCGVLLLFPPLLLLAGWLGEAVGITVPRYWWAFLLLGLLSLFLLVQFAPKLFLTKRRE